MKLLVVDDEVLARQRLVSMIHELGGYDIVGEAGDGKSALLLVDQAQPDVVLLDIRMPGMDGLETARHISRLDTPPAIIFTTAYDEHALEAFSIHAVDYLLKPFRREQLADALTAAQRLTRAQADQISSNVGANRRTNICARIRGSLRLIPVSDIRYFKADQKYVTVRYPGGEVLIEEPIKSLEEEFVDQFIRVHRNALVSTVHLNGLEKNDQGQLVVHLQGIDDSIEISRRHLAEVRRHFKQS